MKEEEGSVKEEIAVAVDDKSVNKTSCNTDNENIADVYDKLNEYLKTRTAFTDDKNMENNKNNSHYKGLNTEVMPTMPVLFIEEFVPPPPYSYLTSGIKKYENITDWRAYIYYDLYRGVYVLNGTRRRKDECGAGIEKKFPDIRMTFRSKSSLAFYLRKSMCSWKHKLSVTMYSMYRSVIHLSSCGAMPSFHSIHHCRTKFRTELFGYDDCNVSLKEFESFLKVLKEGEDDGYLFRPTKSV
jgi:molybdopterin converting factor small subunit